MSEDLQKKEQPGALTTQEELDAYLATMDNNVGRSDVSADELRLPRLGIAQGLSPQMTPDGSQYIDGLKLYEMFNDMSSFVYGRGPLRFVVIKRASRWIEFHPEDRNVVLDMDVPANDPRTLWTTVEKDGKMERVPPAATKFVEFVILLLNGEEQPEPIVLSIKDTNKFNRRAFQRLEAYVAAHPGACYTALYSLRTVAEKNDEGTFGVFAIDKVTTKENPRGLVSKSGYNPAFVMNLLRSAESFRAALDKKGYAVDREPGADDVEFPHGANAGDDGPKM